MIKFTQIPTFEIVESPIPGDPLAPLRMQAEGQSPTTDWRDLLHYHLMQTINPSTPTYQREFLEESNFQGFPAGAFDVQPGDLTRLAQELGAIHDSNEDRVHVLSEDFLEDMASEIKSIFGDAVTNITFRRYAIDKDGNMVEV